MSNVEPDIVVLADNFVEGVASEETLAPETDAPAQRSGVMQAFLDRYELEEKA